MGEDIVVSHLHQMEILVGELQLLRLIGWLLLEVEVEVGFRTSSLCYHVVVGAQVEVGLEQVHQLFHEV